LPFGDDARDFERVVIIKHWRRDTRIIINRQRDMGLIAARALFCAIENNVVHAFAAHGFGRIGPHDPANGLKQV